MTAVDPTPELVTQLLAEHLDGGLVCTSVRRGAVGNGQETWFVDVDAAPGLVLRRSATAGTLTFTERRTEFDVLRALDGSGLPVPRVHWIDEQGGPLGRPYLVMDRLPGAPPRPADDAEPSAIARQLGSLLARLHGLGAEARPPVLHGRDDAIKATVDEVSAWADRYAGVSTRVPLIGALFAWLEANVPDDGGGTVLLWGDPGPHNALVDGGEVSGMLDWELAHAGHPLEDLGGAVWACLGVYDEADVVAGYEATAGTQVDRQVLAYFTVLACVTRTVMQLAGLDAWRRGENRAPNLAGLGLSLLVANLGRAAAWAGWGELAAPEDPLPEPDAAPSTRLWPDASETALGVARFLREDVLGAVEDPVLVRGLKTAVALLDSAGLRASHEPVLERQLGVAVRQLLRDLDGAGVDVTVGLEAVAATVERDESLARWRPRVRAVLLDDLAARRRLLAPLDRLYGSGVGIPPPLPSRDGDRA
jgi:aminoglycoside phosphotransferase (APT) family kinase protein